MQVEFRSGLREVPDHLASLMSDIETYRMTYEEAIEAANRKALADLLNSKAAAVIKQHFEVGR